jgi:transcriptional regulator with XRE-family HTH domain
MYNLDLEELHRRLVAYLQETVRNGTITERRLARITGVSQPHIHQVLKGTKFFSMATAGQILRSLHNDLLDFLEPEDIEEWKKRGEDVVQ